MAENLTAINKALVDGIEQMKRSNTKEVQDLVFGELAEHAKFLMPAKIEGVPGEKSEGNRMGFPMMTDKSGQKFFMAFTDEDELKKWKKDYDESKVVFGFDEYANLILHDGGVAGFVINPFSSNLVIGRKMVGYLSVKKRAAKQGMDIEEITQGKLSFRTPEDYPEEMVEAVRAYLQGNEGIESAYLRLMRKDDEESYLIVVSFQGDLDTVFGAIAEAAKPHLKGMPLAILPANAVIAKQAVKEAEPFYTKPLHVV